MFFLLGGGASGAVLRLGLGGHIRSANQDQSVPEPPGEDSFALLLYTTRPQRPAAADY